MTPLEQRLTAAEKQIQDLKAENARLRKRVEGLEAAATARQGRMKPVNRIAYEKAMDEWAYRNNRKPLDEYCKHYRIPV